MPGFVNPFAVAAPNPQGSAGITNLGPFTLVASVTLVIDNLVAPILRNLQGDTNSVYVDATLAVRPVVVRSQRTRQFTIWPPGTFGWQPLLSAGADKLEVFSSADATISVQVSATQIAAGIFDGGVIKSDADSTRVDIVASVAAQTLLPANVQRQGATIWNESTATLYVLMATGTVSNVNYTVQIGPGGYFETPFAYGGIISGIWSAAVGGARITEFQ